MDMKPLLWLDKKQYILNKYQMFQNLICLLYHNDLIHIYYNYRDLLIRREKKFLKVEGEQESKKKEVKIIQPELYCEICEVRSISVARIFFFSNSLAGARVQPRDSPLIAHRQLRRESLAIHKMIHPYMYCETFNGLKSIL